MNQQEQFEQPVEILKGIGKQTAQRLNKLHIVKIKDLLFHLPLRYEDRTHFKPIGSLIAGYSALLRGHVEFIELTSGRRKSLICRISDNTGFIHLRFFYFSAKQQMQLQPGTIISCYGEVRQGYAGLEIIHPDYKIAPSFEQCQPDLTLTPVYPLTEGLRQATIRKAINQALILYSQKPSVLIDFLPLELKKKHRFPELYDALTLLHKPDHHTSLEALKIGQLPALQRLIFEEFLAHHLSLQVNKKKLLTWQAPVLDAPTSILENFTQSLPFTLTNAQQRVIDEVTSDCKSTTPMMRLIQGDVGSGKTIVCAFAALLAAHCKYQIAIMAPTELLSEQHFQNFQCWFQASDINIALLTSQLKGKARQQLLEKLKSGDIHLIIGTHALFQESVQFEQLGLVIIDEQHRFGVHQRMALREKGRLKNQSPHQLVMTATPIPRTLAMLNYSDLTISVIDELPPGRKTIVTRVIPAEKRQEVITRINNWSSKGKQTYWVCTLIEESEVLQCEAAEKTAQILAELLPNCRIGLVHGRLKPAEKQTIMQEFKQHQIDLLVATTVIEVGVDVPNASLMVIENPERLGLSQLHQLRGRVGRGSDDSYCVLMYQSPLSDTARERLGILRETNDGFVIAEKDLQLRGPGEVMGTRQTGQMRFKIVDLSRDTEMLPKIQPAAEFIQAQHPEMIQALIARWLDDNSGYAEV